MKDKVPICLTEEEKQLIRDTLKPVFQEIKERIMERIAEMVSEWVSKNLPRLLKETEEEEK